MSAYDDLLAGATPSLTYDQWLAQQQAGAERAGGDAGVVINPADYANQVSYNLPGYGDGWQWDVAHNQYINIDPTKSTPGFNNHVTTLHNDGNGGIYTGQQDWDISPNGLDSFLDVAMPLIVAGVTGAAGYAAVGGAAAGAGAGAAGAGEGAAAGTAAGAGEGAAAGGAVSGASDLSLAAGAGEGMEAGAAAGSAAGSGGVVSGASDLSLAAGGAEGSGSALSLADALKYAKTAYGAYSALSGGGSGHPSAAALGQSLGGGGLASYGGSRGSAPAFSSSVQMPQQQQQVAQAPFMLQTAPMTGFAAKDTSQDEINNSSNIMRLAAALRA
jgi:hypothetical protein